MTEKEILKNLIERGIISDGDISDTIDMNKKQKVLAVHHQKIWQGSGTDKRWITRVRDEDAPQGRRKIQKKTEKELFDSLYDYYFGEEKSYKTCTLTDLYEEWIDYKIKTCNSINTPYRLDADYKRFYLNEPVSAKILSTPLLKLTVADIREWAYALIKKHDLTHKSWMNARSILKQVFDYLIDKEVTEKNPVQLTHIPKGVCKKVIKKKAETQVFYEDEIDELITLAIQKADETGDVAFLAIPLFFYTGIRIGECLALTFSDYSKPDHVIHINKMVVSKTERLPDGTWAKRKYEIVNHVKGGGEERDVVVTDECFDLISKIRQLQAKSKVLSYQLFPNITPSNVQFKLYRLCDALELTRRSPHKWRKTYISKLLNDGFDADFVREQVGHKELQTTLNSYAYSTTRKEEQVKKLQKVLSL